MTYQELHLRMDAWRMTATKLAHATGDNRTKLERLNAIAYNSHLTANNSHRTANNSHFTANNSHRTADDYSYNVFTSYNI